MKYLVLALSMALPSFAHAWYNHCDEQAAQWAVEDAVLADGNVCAGGTPAIDSEQSLYTPGGRSYARFNVHVTCKNGSIFKETFDTGGSPADCYKAYFGE